jgi:hypothetical protein
LNEFLRGYIKGAHELIYAVAKANLLSTEQRDKLDKWMENTVRPHAGQHEPPGPPDLRESRDSEADSAF